MTTDCVPATDRARCRARPGAAGSSRAAGSTSDFALARYEADGSPDRSFAGDGTLTTGFGGDSGALAVAVQPDGRIVAAGYGPSGFALARYDRDGSPDPSFDGDGTVSTDFGGSPGAYSCIATAKRYAPVTRLVSVAPAETSIANFDLPGRGGPS